MNIQLTLFDAAQMLNNSISPAAFEIFINDECLRGANKQNGNDFISHQQCTGKR